MMRRFDYLDGLFMGGCLATAVLGLIFATYWLSWTMAAAVALYLLVFFRWWPR